MSSDFIKEVSQGRCHTETWIKNKITILCIADNETISQTLKDLSQPWQCALWTNIRIFVWKLFRKIKLYFVIIVISRYWKYVCHFLKSPFMLQVKKMGKISKSVQKPPMHKSFKVKKFSKICKHYNLIFDFTFDIIKI